MFGTHILIPLGGECGKGILHQTKGHHVESAQLKIVVAITSENRATCSAVWDFKNNHITEDENRYAMSSSHIIYLNTQMNFPVIESA